jgi:hypothetical protein
MRAALRIVRPEDTAKAAVPWYEARWLKRTEQVAEWLVDFTLRLAVAVVAVALVIIGVVLGAMGMMSHFVGGPRE